VSGSPHARLLAALVLICFLVPGALDAQRPARARDLGIIPGTLAPGPLNASMRRTEEVGTSDQSMSPDSTSAAGRPSTSSRMYSASPPPKNPRADTTGRPAKNCDCAT